MLTTLAWISANNARAQTFPVLQFTEVSDTVLTVTYDGSPLGNVVKIDTDHWEWHSGIFPFGVQSASFVPGGLGLQWKEQEDASKVNTVSFGLFLPEDFTSDEVKTAQATPELGAEIFSEADPRSDFGDVLENGALVGPTSVPGITGFLVQFVDAGDNGTGVPDSGSTCVLLLGASVALLGLGRIRPATLG